MRLSEFKLSGMVVEVRYENGYLYWDRCGRIWRQTAEQHPTLKAMQVDTSQARFVLAEGGAPCNLAVDTDKAYCQVPYPDNRKAIGEIADHFVRVVQENLEIAAYTRTGCRLTWERLGPVDGVLDLLRSRGLVPHAVPGVDTRFPLHSVDLTFRSEADGDGCSVKIATFERTFQLSGLPPPVKLVDSGFSGTGMTVDIDVYVAGAIDVEQFVPSAFVESCHRKATRVVESILLT